MTTAYDRLIEHFEKRDLKYDADYETRSVRAHFRGDAASLRIIARVSEDGELFQVFGFPPFYVPEGSRAGMAETISRANYGLKLGKCEMDLQDGELRFQVAHIVVSEMLDETIIVRVIGVTLAMLDMYLPAFLSVIYGNELPQTAIQCAEAGRLR